jgi:predicted RNA-binding Zn ribbon-like protein
VSPDTLIRLSNLGRPRRPAGARAPRGEPVLPDPSTATRQLTSMIPRPVTEADLPLLRHVQQVAVRATEALLAGGLPDCTAINALARDSTARCELAATRGTLHLHLVWSDASIAAGLARRLVEELAALQPNRLRRCARTECGLLFYDSTRSRTRRWHAEDPCGWRGRQHHRRARS